MSAWKLAFTAQARLLEADEATFPKTTIMGVFSVDVTHWNVRPWIQIRTRSLICTSGTLMTMSQIVGAWAGTKVRGSIDSARYYHKEHRYSTLAAVPPNPSRDISSIKASR